MGQKDNHPKYELEYEPLLKLQPCVDRNIYVKQTGAEQAVIEMTENLVKINTVNSPVTFFLGQTV